MFNVGMSLTEEDLDKIQEIVMKVKSDFYEMIEPFLKEVEASRMERELVAAKLADHEDRITVVEQKLHQ